MLRDRAGGELTTWAMTAHRTDLQPYHEVCDERQRDIVARAFAAQIALHGSTF